MGGGDKGGDEAQPQKLEPVPQAQLQTTGWAGTGPTQVPQTFHMGAIPSWMDANRANQQPGHVPGSPNWFGADWWGRSASNPAQMLTNEDLMYQQPVAPPAPTRSFGNLGDYMRQPQEQPWRDQFGNTQAARYMMQDYSGLD